MCGKVIEFVIEDYFVKRGVFWLGERVLRKGVLVGGVFRVCGM